MGNDDAALGCGEVEERAPAARREVEVPLRIREKQLCTVCAEKATKHCPKCKAPYCSKVCQSVDWKDRGHKAECEKRVAAAAKEEQEEEGEDDASSPSDKKMTKHREKKDAPPVVVIPDPVKPAAAGSTTTTTARHTNLQKEAEMTTLPGCRPNSKDCPICLEQIASSSALSLLVCCCTPVCVTCQEKMMVRHGMRTCPMCRAPIPKTDAEVAALIDRNASRGVIAALYLQGQAHEQGESGYAKNFKKAAACYRRAAEQGYAPAQASLGGFYYQGLGVRFDKKESLHWYTLAADANDMHAQYNLGCRYEKGEEVAVDLARAAVNYERAADQGHNNAQYNIAVFYLNGSGVDQDTDKALRYLQLAAKDGYSHATNLLKQLKVKADPRR